MYKVNRDKPIEVLNKFKVYHGGYGHRTMAAKDENGRSAYFTLEFQDLKDSSSKLEYRIFLPLQKDETINWKQYVIHLTKCEASGPPHDNSVPVEFYVTETSTKSM